MIEEFITNMEVTIVLESDMLGTVSMDPAIYKEFIESKKPLELAEEDESATVDKLEERWAI